MRDFDIFGKIRYTHYLEVRGKIFSVRIIFPIKDRICKSDNRWRSKCHQGYPNAQENELLIADDAPKANVDATDAHEDEIVVPPKRKRFLDAAHYNGQWADWS